ncbi:hypothetical protein AGOR_G00225330 [Albula goreensis]|uniref:Pyrin domain-containing protein n=1 Tax=Albula goreensis TaxID=1534307 RepID=A0A8T3CLD9_9TELE|nr:hypothetical protein AGOR_G00225330 [Albula goreensis]
MAGVPSMLISTLDDLIADELKRFKFCLLNELPEGFNSIGRGKLEGKGVLETVDLMVRAYGEEDAVKVTLYALRKTDQNNLAQKLDENYRRCVPGGGPNASPSAASAPVGQACSGGSALRPSAAAAHVSIQSDGGKVVAPVISGSNVDGSVNININLNNN